MPMAQYKHSCKATRGPALSSKWRKFAPLLAEDLTVTLDPAVELEQLFG